jgi:hypothetical protein
MSLPVTAETVNLTFALTREMSARRVIDGRMGATPCNSGGSMRADLKFACYLTVFFGLTFAGEAMAQAPAVHFQVGFTANVDCDRPIQVRNFALNGQGTGVLNADKSASADLTVTAFLIGVRIHFDARLGQASQPAPGGASQVRVAGKNRLRLTWFLPNNQLIADISVKGQSCSATVDTKLKPGMREYTLFDGTNYHYCGRPRVTGTSCSVS